MDEISFSSQILLYGESLKQTGLKKYTILIKKYIYNYVWLPAKFQDFNVCSHIFSFLSNFAARLNALF